VRLGPNAEVQALDARLQPGPVERFLHDAAQILERDRDAEARVRLDPDGFVGPVIARRAAVVRLRRAGIPARLAGIELADIREPPLVGDDLLEHLDRIIVVLPADRRLVVPGVREFEEQRVEYALEPEAHLVDDDGGRVLVELVDQCEIRALVVERTTLSGERPEERIPLQPGDIVRADIEQIAQIGRPFGHFLRVIEQIRGLFAVNAEGIDFRRRGRCRIREPLQSVAAGRGRLAAALAGLDVAGLESAVAVDRLPGIHRPEHELHPRQQAERRAVVERQQILEEREGVGRLGRVEHVGKRRRGLALDIAEMPCAGETDRAPGQDSAGRHVDRILRDGILSLARGAFATLRASTWFVYDCGHW
jgi:hypothetical protein